LLWLLTLGVSALPWAASTTTAFAQNHDDQFFAGTVMESTPEQITVSRVLQGKPESRTFRITPETKIEGNLLVNARVTVGYDGDRATLIIVRDDAKDKKFVEK